MIVAVLANTSCRQLAILELGDQMPVITRGPIPPRYEFLFRHVSGKPFLEFFLSLRQVAFDVGQAFPFAVTEVFCLWLLVPTIKA